MRRSKWLMLFGCALMSLSLRAQVDRSPLKIKTPPPQFDLLKENESIAPLSEQTIQREEPASRHILAFSIGSVAADSLSLHSNAETVNYDLSQKAVAIGAGFGWYPARLNGYWGLISSINYAFREQENAGLAPTSLHLIATDILFSYRYEMSAHSWLKPYVGVGPGINLVFQRGVDELNTSEAKGLLVGEVGLGFNVKRLFNMSSPLDWELTAQYKRWFDSRTSNSNYNGSIMSVGLSMIL